MTLINKIIVLYILLNFLFISFSQSIKEKIDSLLIDPFFESSIMAADIYDLTAQKYLFRLNSKLLLHPASNMKLLTSVAALKSLGSEYQFLTSLYYDGEISDNTLYGNLYIEGGCDPEIKTDDLIHFISELKALKIHSIEGNIYGDISFKDSLFWGSGWMWDDDPSTDAPYLSALNINNNSVNISVSGANIGQPADVLINPHSSFFSIRNLSTTVFSKQAENFTITRNWIDRKNEIIITGNVSLEKDNNPRDKSVNVFNPDMYFLTLFKETLIKNGIAVKGEIGIKNLPLLNKYIKSIPTPIMAILTKVNKNSNNLSAEMLLYAMAEKFGGRPATAKNGIKLINELIKLCGHSPEKYRIVDGSGVSHYNLVSAELLTDILKYIYTKEKSIYNKLIETLPVSGIDGTLSARMVNSAAYNNVRAKTGTLSGVSALSGYTKTASGNQIAFSILIQNFVGQSEKARSIQDEICRILAEHK